MGKSAKFYKRPSRKEKEVISVKKLVEPTISKKTEKKTISVPTALFEDKNTKADKKAEEDVDMDAKPVKKKKEEVKEKPDYVDLFSGKKTYKKIPKKRK